MGRHKGLKIPRLWLTSSSLVTATIKLNKENDKMAKIGSSVAWKPERKHKKTSQSSRRGSLKFSSMNKSKKRQHKQYRGQGS